MGQESLCQPIIIKGKKKQHKYCKSSKQTLIIICLKIIKKYVCVLKFCTGVCRQFCFWEQKFNVVERVQDLALVSSRFKCSMMNKFHSHSELHCVFSSCIPVRSRRGNMMWVWKERYRYRETHRKTEKMTERGKRIERHGLSVAVFLTAPNLLPFSLCSRTLNRKPITRIPQISH